MRTHILKYRKTVLISLLLLSTGCASYNPYIGQPFNQWKNQADLGTMSIPKMVLAEGSVQAWTLGDGVFYYFRDGVMYKVDQGAGAQQRLQIEVLK